MYGSTPCSNIFCLFMDQNDVIFYDFFKAFDKVSHASLIVKLRAAGIDGKLLEWISDWLKGRKKKVVVVEKQADADALQRDIDQFCRWACLWEMDVAKCKVMHVGRIKQGYEYLMNGVKLAEVHEKDLGVCVTKDMKPMMQCEKAARSANMVLGMILR